MEVVVDGPADAMPLVYHSGTPSAAGRYRPIIATAAARGLRTVNYSRPGYSRSTPNPGRTVAAVASDVAAILDALGADDFVTLGWSGGGPPALACAALLPGRCRSAATLAGVAPYDAAGLDWSAGMGEENIVEFGAAVEGTGPLQKLLETWAPALGSITAATVADGLGDLVPEVDRAAITGELADYLAAGFHDAVSNGVAGWRDDDLAFAAPWGFDLAAIAVPVSVWQGGADRMVPYAHGQWLAAHIGGARAHLHDDHGHLSLAAEIDAILDDLVDTARR